MNNLSSYCGLVDAEKRASDKDLPVVFNMETIPKSDIKSVIKSDITFDISIKLTTWIGRALLSLEKS